MQSGLHSCLICMSDFEWRLISLVFTTSLFLMGEIKASKKKHHVAKCPVVLSVLLAKCSDEDAEGFCFQVLFYISHTLTGISADILILLGNRKNDASS